MNHFFKRVLFSIILCSTLHAEYPQNNVSVKLAAGFGGRFSAQYERRMSDSFGLEFGAAIGEELTLRLHKVHYFGPFIGFNCYFTKAEAKHQAYLAPMLFLSYGESSYFEGKASAREGVSRQVRVISFMPVLFGGYRYRFSFNGTLEAGLGIDVFNFLVPAQRGAPLRVNFAPIPKFQIGLGYEF